MSALSFLDSFGGDYRPQQPIRNGIDTMPDGDYDLVIVDASFAQVNTDNILRIGLQTNAGGVYEWTHWLNRQQGVNALAADLLLLGFDSDHWGPQFNRPLSVEFAKAIPQLPGRRFRAKKTTREGKVPSYPPGAKAPIYHNLHIAGLIRPNGGGPAGPAPAPVPNPTPTPAAPAAAAANDPIPF